jgi:hypothetical protein
MMNGDGTILGEYIEGRWNQPSAIVPRPVVDLAE